jgi:transcriptional regulator GlxA family with amidase domain
MTDRLQVAIPLFPKFTALDAVGPYEVLQRIPSIDVTFIGHRRGEVRSENGMLGITVDAPFEELPTPDVVVFPGGVGTRPLEQDDRVLAWVRNAHRTSRLTTSVCTGSLVLGAAGLLEGLSATTHWACYAELEAHGAVPVATRVVEHLDERIVTAAGVSSGIDMVRSERWSAATTSARAAIWSRAAAGETPGTCTRRLSASTPARRATATSSSARGPGSSAATICSPSQCTCAPVDA